MIRAEHIVKSFDGRVVLKDISATFATGKTNLIIGQSGSGKTVLLKSLVGLHAIDSGQIYYDDVCYTSLSFTERKAIRQQIGMIFQGAHCSTPPRSKRTCACRSTCSPTKARKRNATA